MVRLYHYMREIKNKYPFNKKHLLNKEYKQINYFKLSINFIYFVPLPRPRISTNLRVNAETSTPKTLEFINFSNLQHY